MNTHFVAANLDINRRVKDARKFAQRPLNRNATARDFNLGICRQYDNFSSFLRLSFNVFDEVFFLQHLCYRVLKLGVRHQYTIMASAAGILDLYNHVRNSIHTELPGRFLNARNLAFIGKFSKADTTEVEVTHVTTPPATTKTTRSRPSRELGLLFRPCDN